MKKNLLKFVCIVCSFLLLISFSVGCAKDKDAKGGGTEKQSSSSDSTTQTGDDIAPIKASLMAWSVNRDNTEGIKNDRILAYVKDKFKLNLEILSADGQQEKYSTTLAAGDVPDIMFAWTGMESVQKAAEEGMFLNMNDVVSKNPQKYPVLSKMFSDKFLKYYNDIYFTDAENFYGIPAPSQARYVFGSIIFNMKEMQALGQQMPASIDEFINLLRVVKNQSKMTPFTAHNIKGTSWSEFNWLFFQPQGGSLDIAQLNDDEKITTRVTEPVNKDIWKQISQWYKEGLLDREMFTKEAYYHLGEFNGGKLFSCAGMLPYDNPIMHWWFMDFPKQPGYTQSDAKIMPFPFKGPNGETTRNAKQSIQISGYVHVSAKTKDPERVLSFLNWLFSKEGQTTVFYGLDGIHHIKDSNGNPVVIEEEWKKEKGNWNQPDAAYWAPFNIVTFSGHIYDVEKAESWFDALQKSQETIDVYTATSPQDEYLAHGTEITKNFIEHTFIELPPYASFRFSEAEFSIQRKVNDLCNKYFVGFVTGQIDVEANWDKFVKEFNETGCDILERAAQGYYDKNKKLYDTIK